MAANNISTLQYKRDRQNAKLALAEQDRAARNVIQPGRYSDVTADATQLPTRYGIDSNDPDDIVDNDNAGGLQLGRPWA